MSLPDSQHVGRSESSNSPDQIPAKPAPDPSLLDALAGQDAHCACRVSMRTRRAVQTSISVLQAQQLENHRNRKLAAACVLLLLLLVGPLLWGVVFAVLAGVRLNDASGMLSLLVLMFALALLAAAALAGWRRTH